MKQRIWIFLVLAVCVGMICFGVCNLCTRQGPARAEAKIPADNASPEAGKTAPKDTLRHYAGLEYVAMPSLVASQEYDYMGFRVSFNRHNRTPNWVAWELLGSETGGEASRHNKFWQDPNVEGCPTTYDYRNSGYDRGHMCPAAEQKWSDEAMNDCFVMANMCPQDHSLNSGAWNTLENRERNWACRDSAIVIVAGPIYENGDINTIGGGVLVPSAFFKVLLAPYLEQPRAIGFVFPNMSAPGNMQNYVMTVDDVETLTGYDFFSALPDDMENEVESKASFREWNQR